jgi:hypothetical protein
MTADGPTPGNRCSGCVVPLLMSVEALANFRMKRGSWRES